MQKYKHEVDMRKSLLVLISFLVWSVGCTSMSQQVATNIPPAQYKELGEADCKKCSFLLLDVIGDTKSL